MGNPADVSDLFQGRRAPCPIHVVVVGCGLGGLSAAYCLAEAGHTVTILESALEIGEIGAGIQVSPNVTRLLIRWGLGDKLKQVTVKPEALTFRRCTASPFSLFIVLMLFPGSTGETIAWTKWGNTMDLDYGAPYYHIHVQSPFFPYVRRV